jgi:hypothetical protein
MSSGLFQPLGLTAVVADDDPLVAQLAETLQLGQAGRASGERGLRPRVDGLVRLPGRRAWTRAVRPEALEDAGGSKSGGREPRWARLAFEALRLALDRFQLTLDGTGLVEPESSRSGASRSDRVGPAVEAVEVDPFAHEIAAPAPVELGRAAIEGRRSSSPPDPASRARRCGGVDGPVERWLVMSARGSRPRRRRRTRARGKLGQGRTRRVPPRRLHFSRSPISATPGIRRSTGPRDRSRNRARGCCASAHALGAARAMERRREHRDRRIGVAQTDDRLRSSRTGAVAS